MNGPIVLAPYDPAWPAQFAGARTLLVRALCDDFAAVEHIGSTAIPGMPAKPTIDILAGLAPGVTPEACRERLAALGYEPAFITAEWSHFCLTPDNPRYNLHVTPHHSEFWKRHLLFRDFLRAHPDTAQDYLRLKRELAALFGSNRHAYSEAKTPFVRAVEARARAEAAVKG